MLPLANGRLAHLHRGLLHLVVHLPAVLLRTLLHLRRQLLLHLLMFVLAVLVVDLIKLALVQRQVVAAPLPRHHLLAPVAVVVVRTRRADAPVGDRRGLQPVGENDVRVHGAHIQVVYHGRLMAVRTVAQHLQHVDDLLPDLAVVRHVMTLQLVVRPTVNTHSVLHLDTEGQHHVHRLDQLLERRRVHVELVRDVVTVHAALQALHRPADVGVRL